MASTIVAVEPVIDERVAAQRPGGWRREAALVGVGALVVPLVVLGPNLPGLRAAAIGARGSDALKHVWSQWWAWRTVAEEGRLPLHTDLLAFPEGGPFFSLDLANAVVGGPLRAVCSPVLVYNLLLVAHLGLAFAAAWALARSVTGSPGASLVAGTAYAASPWIMAFPLASGVSETAFLWPLPLVLLCAWRTLRGPGWGAPVLGAALWALQAIACSTYALIAGILLAFSLAVWLSRRPWRLPPGAPFRADAGAALRIGLVVVLTVALTAPLAVAVAGTVASGVYERPLAVFAAFDPRSLAETHSVAMAHLVSPGDAALRVHEGADRLYTTGYLGWTLLLAAALGAWRARRSRYALGAAALFVALALGPMLTVDLARTTPDWPNPVYLLSWFTVPLFSLSMHGADRFVVGASLCLGLAAAVGVSRADGPRSTALGVALSIAILVESIAVSPAPWPIPQAPAAPSPVAHALAHDDGAVLDLPFTEPGSARLDARILLDQTVHQRPVPFRLEGRGLDAVSGPVRQVPELRALQAALAPGSIPAEPVRATCAVRPALHGLGFRDLVIHPDRATGDVDAVVALLTRCLGAPTAHDGALRFRLEAP